MIVERLRDAAMITPGYLLDEAADEIERLKAENEKLVHACRIGAKHMDRVEELEARVEALEGELYRNGFVRCDIPACNCGSWHHTGGFAARFREIDEATDDFWRNGETLLDRIKRIAATEQEDSDE